jgi:predicted cupin superfamily sugar epimerase
VACMDIEKLKQTLGLKPLPEEGGFYAESYRSDEKLAGRHLPTRYSGDRYFGTAIYFLLTAGTFSALHRLSSDEIYHFYLGGPVEALLLRENGSGEVVTMGTDFDRGMRPQVVAPHGTWQGSRVRPGGNFALLGTTVAPGFEFADCELANREALLAKYPKFSEMIQQLTR